MQKNTLIGAVTAAVLLLGTTAESQISNKPYQFRGGASVGMSNAAREAILRQKLLNETPRNLVRGPSGELLDVEKGPGGTAIVSERGGRIIPGFRGRPLFRSGSGIGVGIFNAFFLTRPGDSTGAAAFFSSGSQTRASIAGWTGMVSSGGGAGMVPSGHSPVESWTTQVFIYYGE